ncbi:MULTISPECIES: hypothetical protein [unclassified Microbacterium]|uniref:hypothetical protein n=1 Tax=unclassified Microbacterium TaxID=2609290 RepID=UPI0022AFEC90|nr:MULTISPECIES: hypothetical protein [unclassified Microbacterium]MCZ4066320.1 hypothetical protein [Microbacterium sp. H37-C3]WHE34734.1 hypothetical protein P6897_08365 [Microbacterium sp. BDGP8]
MRTARAGSSALLMCAIALTAGCASTPAAGPTSLDPAPPSGEVVAQGTVLDDGSGAELCLGAVAESAPPQCDGIPVKDWDWSSLSDATTMSGSTWGTYAVQGRYDGSALTVTAPAVPLALYDPMPIPDPTGGLAGTADDATLRDVEQRVHDTLGDTVLASGAYDGRLWVTVVWDDGTLQDAADAEFGADVVVVQSAMREVG